MNKRKGFTLIELLIAATIIGALAVFATVSYRASEADTRIAAAKAKTDALAGAMRRFHIEFPRAGLNNSVIENTTAACPSGVSSATNLSATVLISCGQLDNRGWTNDYVEFTVCGTNTDGICANLTAPGACMTGKSTNSRMPARYKGNYAYCVTEAGVSSETFGS